MTQKDFARPLKKLSHQAIAARLHRISLLLSLQQRARFQGELFQDLGRTRPMQEEAEVPSEARACELCEATFATRASLAVHASQKHGAGIAVRRPTLLFHTRPRLSQRLQSSSSNCWIPMMRHFHPLSPPEAVTLNKRDRRQQVAHHQRGFSNNGKELIWRIATEQEVAEGLQLCLLGPFDRSDPDDEKIALWSCWGLLPPGRGGRPIAQRCPLNPRVENVTADPAPSSLRGWPYWRGGRRNIGLDPSSVVDRS